MRFSINVVSAYIVNDGKQTPMRGHPVFIAPHATATCCRECIRKWQKRTKPSTAGISCRCNYDMDSKRNEEELVQIFFDADACPEVGIVEIIAKEHNVVI